MRMKSMVALGLVLGLMLGGTAGAAGMSAGGAMHAAAGTGGGGGASFQGGVQASGEGSFQGLPENPGRLLVSEILQGGARDVPADVYQALYTIHRSPVGLQVAMAVYAAREAGGTGTQVAPPFADLGSVGWAAGAVEALHSAGVIQGVGGGNFDPGGIVNREELVTMLMRIRGEASGSTGTSLPGVAPWAQAAMQAAVQDGIVQGNGQGLDPTGSVTRYQAITLILRAFGLSGEAATETSAGITLKTHAPVPAWAAGYVALGLHLGLVQGENGYLDGSKPLTRAQLAVLLERVLSLEAEAE